MYSLKELLGRKDIVFFAENGSVHPWSLATTIWKKRISMKLLLIQFSLLRKVDNVIHASTDSVPHCTRSCLHTLMACCECEMQVTLTATAFSATSTAIFRYKGRDLFDCTTY